MPNPTELDRTEQASGPMTLVMGKGVELLLPAFDAATGWANGLHFAVIQGLRRASWVQVKAWGFWG